MSSGFDEIIDMDSNVKDRKTLEREFHNKLRVVGKDMHVMDTRWSLELEETIQNNPLWRNMKYYAVERKSRQMVLKWYEDNCKGKRVLDYCCGNGEDSRIIAGCGAEEVVGIDISHVSIKNCRRLALEVGYNHTTKYLVRDAEATGFEDNAFDIITEYGALHHLDLEKALAEMRRILRPNGKIICNEALAHNPIIHNYRRRTLDLRTEWEVENIMRKKDFDIAQKHFEQVEMHFFHLCTLAAIPVRKTVGFYHLLTAFEWFDSLLLKLPGLRWWAWQVVFILSGPKE